MLLNKYSGKANQYRQDRCGVGGPGMFSAPFVLSQSNVHADRIEAMNTGENIVGGIACLQHLQRLNQEIAPAEGIVINAQGLVVGEDHINDLTGCHSNIEECTHPQKVRPIIEEEKDITDGDIGKP